MLKRIFYRIESTENWDRIARTYRIGRLEYAAKQQMLHLVELEPHDGKCAIVGAAPTVTTQLAEIIAFQDSGGLVMSLNGAHRWLIERSIIPRIHVLFEIDMGFEDVTGGPPHKDVYYYICSHYDSKVVDQLEGYHRVLWHSYDEDKEYQDTIIRLFPGEVQVAGGFVTFFRSINIARILGFRNFEIFGCDASFEDEKTHIDGYPNISNEKPMVVAAGTEDNNRQFTTTPTLSNLANEFMNFCEANQHSLRIKVHGDGMMHHLHQMVYPEQYS